MASFYGQCFTAWLRLKHRLKGSVVFDILKKLEQEQYLSQQALERLQIDRCNALLSHATKRSEFYRRRLGSSGVMVTSLKDLESLPLLTRSDLQQFSTDILVAGDPTTYADSSGGSTGNPVNFYHDGGYKETADALELLFLSWMTVLPGDKTAAFWGADRDFAELSARERLAMRLKRSIVLNSFDVTEAKMNEYLDLLAQWRPEFVIGYASSLALAADSILRTGRTDIRPRALRSSAEMLYPSQRQSIEKAFGTQVHNFYGSREVSHLAAECDRHDGLHIFASSRIVEVCDESGRQLPPGQLGQLVITDLTNKAFPFIRYAIGDMAVMSETSCSCKRSFPLLKELAGRSSDILTVNGRHIHGEFFTHLFYGRPEVRQFQVVQETTNRLRIKMVVSGTTVDTSAIESVIRTKVGHDADIVFESVPHIAPQRSGKYRFTVNLTTGSQ